MTKRPQPDALDEAFLDFIRSSSKIDLVARVSELTLTDFPKSLPSYARTKLTTDIRQLTSSLQATSAQPPTGVASPISLTLSSPLAKVIFDLGYSSSLSGNPDHHRGLKDMDFTSVVLEQELTMAFTALDAFMGDAARAIVRLQPRVLASSQTELTAAAIIEHGSWDAVIEALADQFAQKRGFGDIPERLKAFRQHIACAVDPVVVAALVRADFHRNLIVHNGSRATDKFIRHTGRTDLKRGDRVPIAADDVKTARQCMKCLVVEIYTDISRKFLKREPLYPQRIPVPASLKTNTAPPAGEG